MHCKLLYVDNVNAIPSISLFLFPSVILLKVILFFYIYNSYVVMSDI